MAETTLHQRLLDGLDKPYEIWTSGEAANQLGAIRVALRAVVKLHRPCAAGEDGECLGCRIDGVAFTWWRKCPTIVAIAQALGEATDD